MGCSDVKSVDHTAFSGETNEEEEKRYSKSIDKNSSTVEMRISCQDLPGIDAYAKTDPMIFVYLKNQLTEKLEIIGRTEMIENNTNPHFVKSVVTKYYFEKKQYVHMKVVYIKDPNRLDDLSAQNLVGIVDFLLSDGIRSPDKTLKETLVLPNQKNNSIVSILFEEYKTAFSADMVKMKVEGEIKSKQDIFFLISRIKKNSKEFIPVYKSEKGIIAGNSIRWKIVKVAAGALILDDPSHRLKIEIFAYESNGIHRYLGSFEKTYSELASDTTIYSVPDIKLKISHVEICHRESFMNYLFGGINISLSLAIDFTSSNKDPLTAESLHCLTNPSNPYKDAINSVGNVLLNYDVDKKVPVLGFGACLPSFESASDCFALNGNIFSPEVHNLDSIINLYHANLPKLELYGPTYFAPIIRYIGDIAEFSFTNRAHYDYYVLLILTDGKIDDEEQTIDEIVRCSDLPLSIIIVGIGSCDFSSMNKLDADSTPLFSKKYGKEMSRDIVQFVPFSLYEKNPEKLAEETLAELPRQIVDFMTSKNLPPLMGFNSPVASKSIYDAKKAAFAKQFSNLAHPENINTLLDIGFPSESIEEFRRALLSGFTNYLAPPTIIPK